MLFASIAPVNLLEDHWDKLETWTELVNSFVEM